ncbi:hypothetical protein ACIQJ8_35770 [Streptomyces globisporus]|uniref:hypothetical protein n=1 Tax=Streptomyces globisporus TaxID=1908 RepID=UPI00380D850A
MSQHSPIPPDDCTSCRKVFAQLSEAKERLTAGQLSEAVSLAERTVRVHVTHLVTHKRVQDDRRTPVPGAIVGPVETADADVWTALDWVLTATCPDRTCRRIMIVLAREADAAWGGQLSVQEIAERVGASVRTVSTHRAHLVAARLLRLTPDTTVRASGHRERRPDRYLILGQQTAATGQSWEEDAARDVLAQIGWWPGASQKESQRAVWRILRRMRNGWPPHEITARCAIEPGRAVVHRLRLLDTLLPAADAPYVIPAREVASGIPAGPVYCPRCGTKYPSTTPVDHGHVCRACRQREAEAAVTSAPALAGAYDSPF